MSNLNTLFAVCSVFFGIQLTHGIQRRYLTQLCPGSVGPTHGEVIRFDPNFNDTQWIIPEGDIDCYLTLRGMPTTDPTIPWYVTLTWPAGRKFTIRGWDYANTKCDTAFLEVYRASVAGKPEGNPIVPKMCGDVKPPDITSTNQAIVLRVYAEREPIIPSTTTTTTTTTTPAPGASTAAPAAAAVTTAAATVSNSTGGGGNGTSSGNGTASGNSTAPDTGGPYIQFRADFTSYFLDCGTDGADNDEEQLQCNNNRCIDMSLRCDQYGADNCGDKGDQLTTAPGNCTSEPPPTELDTTLIPLYAILGAIALFIICYWCCWRPGYLPWRLARCRNIKCCRKACRPCRKAKCTKNGMCGPAAGCFTKCTRGGCNRTKSGFPDRKPDDVDFNEANTVQAWLTYAHSDGMHVREMR